MRLYEGMSVFRVRDILDFSKIDIAVKERWLVHEDERLRATREGMLRLDTLLSYILK